MTSTEIFSAISLQLNDEIFQHLHDQDRSAYRAALQVVTSRRKLRPVFLERKSKSERHAWMKDALSRKTNEDAAQEILQAWLLGAHRDLICAWLDCLGVSHENGLLESLPAQPSEETLRRAVDAMVERWPAAVVAVYLQMFQQMDIARWPHLASILENDERLQLKPVSAEVLS